MDLICPLGSSGASPMSQDQWKQRGLRQHQQLQLRILYGTQNLNRESQADGPHLVAWVSGLVYRETHALVAMSSGRLSVSSPVFWPWGQLAFNVLHPCYWTLKNRVAAAKLTVGGWCLWWFPESRVCLVGSWPAWGKSVLGPPEQCNSGSSSVPMPGNRPWHVSFHRHNTCLPPVSLFTAKTWILLRQ